MNFLGIHGTGHIAWAIVVISAPFWLLTWFDGRLHPDTVVMVYSIYAVLIVTAALLFIIVNEQQGSAVVSVIWVFAAAINIWVACRHWSKWLRARAEDLR